MNKSTITKSLLVFLGLGLASASFASCSHHSQQKESVSQNPAPQTIKTFASVKSDK